MCEESPRKEDEAEREEREGGAHGQKGKGKSTWVSKADLLHFFNFSSVSARVAARLLLRCMAHGERCKHHKHQVERRRIFQGGPTATSTSHPQTHKESGNGIKSWEGSSEEKRFSGK